MGFFGKKKDIIEKPNPVESPGFPEKSEEQVLKEDLEVEVEKLQNEFRTKQQELADNEKKVQSVKEEYDAIVANLMVIKKETNQKKMELDTVIREYRDIKQKIEESEEKYQKSKKIISELDVKEKEIKNSKEELEKLRNEDLKIQEQISQSKAVLHETKVQEIEAKKELEEITSKLYNTKHELGKSENLSIFSEKEKEFIENQISKKPETKSIIEAASAVTASLKSKLTRTEKELETVQQLLEKERKDHEITKGKLERLSEHPQKKS